MKKISMLVCSVFFVLLASTLAFADFTQISDEFAIDYQTYELQIFTLGKNSDIFWKQAQDVVFNYIQTLTHGEDEKKLADVFKARPALRAKVLAIVLKDVVAGDAFGNRNNWTKPTNLGEDGFSLYFYFNLNTLKPVLPDLNFPTP